MSSPTFTLVQEYHGRVTLHHVDLYRLKEIQVGDLGLDELTSERAVVAVEWAERREDAPPRAWVVRISNEGEDKRRISIAGPSDGRDPRFAGFAIRDRDRDSAMRDRD